jgi:hypothetical protein
MEDSKICRSLVENVCVLIDFVYENDVGRVWAKKFS